jgi:acyl dehydratase
MAIQIASFEGIKKELGKEIGISNWLRIDQDKVNNFSDCTFAKSPFGKTSAHGYLPMSLLYYFLGNYIVLPKGMTMINYGMDKVRLLEPVKAGSNIRDKIFFTNAEKKASGILATTSHTIEIEGQKQPALIAKILTLFIAG